uniref:Pept_C1 domain-containing protein n=1 Tax=Meloidogyne hapla TaxID=6305 RepID=A0A1I8AYK6_MELHA
MEKIAIIFSILFILNLTSNSKALILDSLLGVVGGLVGNTATQIINIIRNTLAGVLDLTNDELLNLTEVLRLLKSIGISIDTKKLKLTAQNVVEINELTNGIWTAKLGFYSLLPDEDQKKICGVLDFVEGEGGDKSRDRRAARNKRKVNCSYKTEFDVRDKWPGCRSIINHVQDQGFCGSCWAVSTASAFTDRYCIERAKKGLKTPNNANNIFSSFDVLACSPAKGCTGGWPVKAWESIKSNGICTGSDFNDKNGCKPYPFGPTERYPILKACKKSCTNSYWEKPYDNDRMNYVISVSTLNGEDAIKDELRKNGPVVAIFSVYKDFYSYSDGVYYRVWGELDKSHAVVIVGYGTANCGYEKIPYWIIRNSMGTNWGEGGYFKFRRGDNECGIEAKISFGIPKVNSSYT